MRTYSELIGIPTLLGRFEYLSLRGIPFGRTFGGERWINQRFYTSREWRDVRREVVLRDEGLDLAVPGIVVYEHPIVHHMNPMDVDDIRHGNLDIFDPEYLITVSLKTHNAIHYGDSSQLVNAPINRRPGDTKLW